MLKSALATALAKELDDEDNSDFINLLYDWIDEVVSDMAIRFGWEYLNTTLEKTLTSGSNTLTIEDAVNILAIQREDDDTLLIKGDKQYLMEHGIDLDQTGDPDYWFISSFDQDTQDWVIGFDATPGKDIDLLINVLKEVGALASSDHIPFPADALFILKHGVRAYFYLHEEQHNSWQAHERKYERGIARFIETHSAILADRTISPQDSDLNIFGGTGSDPNLRLNRRTIPEV